MSEIDWSLAPEGAESLVQRKCHVTWAKGLKLWDEIDERWCDSLLKWQTIATRPTKTVADAVEWHQKNDKICGYSFSQNTMLSFCKSNGTYCFVSEKSSAGSVETDDWQPICTRAEFEAYVKEQESEKWTHRTNAGELCSIHVKEPDVNGVIIVINERGEYLRHNSDSLKPIKPTMTEAQQEMVAKFVARIYKNDAPDLRAEFDAFCDEHDII